jgi:sugar phosphate permease
MKVRKLHYGWIVIFMGMLTTIAAHGFGRMSYTVILPSMKTALDLSYTQMGWLGTGNFVGYLTMAIIGGFLAARFGTRIVITAALILMGATLILTGLTQSFGFAFAMRLLTGLGNGASYVPAMALGSAWFVIQRRGFATGIVSAGIGIGLMISGFGLPHVVNAFGPEGWRYSWYLLGGAVTLIAGIVFLFVRSRPEEKGLKQVGEIQQETDSANSDCAQPREAVSVQWTEAIKIGAVWYLGVVYFFYGLSYIIYLTYFTSCLHDVGINQVWAGRLFGWMGGLSIFCGVLWGGISDRLGRSKGSALAYLVLAISYFIYAVSLFVYQAYEIKFGFILSAIFFGLTAWSIPTIMAAAAGDFVGPRLAPAGLGFITVFFGVGQAIGPALGGYLRDVTQTFTVPFLVAACISLIGMLSSFYLKKLK